MPTYEYVCDDGHITVVRSANIDEDNIVCMAERVVCCEDHPEPCWNSARRRSFYYDTAVTRLPTRGPIIPPSPAPRSTKGESSDTWLEMTHEEAYRQHDWAKKYSRGGELADRHDERPTGTRE